MREAVVNYIKECTRRFDFGEPILDTCAGWEPNYYEPLFPGKKYIKHDMRDFDPPCIDIVCDITDMKPLADASVGSVLYLEAVHNTAYPQRAIDEIYRVLKPGGLLAMTTHMFWPIVHSPKDYWRFCPHGIELLLAKFEILDFTLEGDANHPTGLWTIARKSDDQSKLGKLPPANQVRIPTNWLWYWLIKRPLEKFFHLEVRRLTPESGKIAEL